MKLKTRKLLRKTLYEANEAHYNRTQQADPSQRSYYLASLDEVNCKPIGLKTDLEGQEKAFHDEVVKWCLPSLQGQCFGL